MNLQKDILAKLLATENLTVVHENVRTASFNVKERILTLPIWQDMESYTYDHLVGHEVGHALYTPTEGWHESVSTKGAGYKSYLNVIEDARIERMIQTRYPGLRREFVKSYKKMLGEGFFGDDIESINNYDLIDRINVYFKCGASSGVKLTADEMKWVREIEAAQTWEQVVDIADRMYGAAKEKMEEERAEQQQDSMDEDDEGMEDENSNHFEDGEGEEDDEDQEGDGEGEEDDDSENETEEDQHQPKSKGDEPTSKTDDALRDSIANEYDTDPNAVVTNLFINDKLDAKHFVIGYKEVLQRTQDLENLWKPSYYNHNVDREELVTKLYNEFMANNKKTINYLVKEFEMKKSAANYARAFVSKTGVIDPVLMNSYKYNDDIFRKATIVPDGKNHGMIMYLDWSGSMHRDMLNTIEQTLNLVYFCRQVNIPFRVYAFTNAWEGAANAEWNLKYKEMYDNAAQFHSVPENAFRLVEFFSNKMNKMQFARMTKVLLGLGKNITYASGPFRLNGTPLQTTLTIAPAIHDLFQQTNKVDIVNTVFLTDGDSHPFTLVKDVEGYEGKTWRTLADSNEFLGYGWRNDTRIVNLYDHAAKKKYKVTGANLTKTLIQNYIYRTGSNAIGYRIMSGNKHVSVRDFEGFGMPWYKANELWENLKKQKYITIPGAGYSKFFALKGGKELETANGAFTVAEDAKKGQILSAFRKANKGKLVSRSLLNEFIKEVA